MILGAMLTASDPVFRYSPAQRDPANARLHDHHVPLFTWHHGAHAGELMSRTAMNMLGAATCWAQEGIECRFPIDISLPFSTCYMAVLVGTVISVSCQIISTKPAVQCENKKLDMCFFSEAARSAGSVRSGLCRSHRGRQFENGRGLVHSRSRAVVKQRRCKRHHVSRTRRRFTSSNAPVSGWK